MSRGFVALIPGDRFGELVRTVLPAFAATITAFCEGEDSRGNSLTLTFMNQLAAYHVMPSERSAAVCIGFEYLDNAECAEVEIRQWLNRVRSYCVEFRPLDSGVKTLEQMQSLL